jgi:hypothetical protein
MLKKSLVIMSISAAFFAQAQDVSVIRNTVDVYSNAPNVVQLSLMQWLVQRSFRR